MSYKVTISKSNNDQDGGRTTETVELDITLERGGDIDTVDAQEVIEQAYEVKEDPIVIIVEKI